MATDDLLDVGGEREVSNVWRVHRDMDSNNLDEKLVSHEEKKRLIIQALFPLPFWHFCLAAGKPNRCWFRSSLSVVRGCI